MGGRGGGGARFGLGASGADTAWPLAPFCFLSAGLESSSDESSDKSDESGSAAPLAVLDFGLDLGLGLAEPLLAPFASALPLTEVVDEIEVRGLAFADGP